MTASGISQAAVENFSRRERSRFIERNPKSVALAERAHHSLYAGVPMHWMADWSTPTPLFVERAKGARFYDVDGHEYIDFCLGDTGTIADVGSVIKRDSGCGAKRSPSKLRNFSNSG